MKTTAVKLMKHYAMWSLLLSVFFLAGVAFLFFSAIGHEEELIKVRLSVEAEEDAQSIDDKMRHARLHLSTMAGIAQDYYRLSDVGYASTNLFDKLQDKDGYFTFTSIEAPYAEKDVGTVLATGSVRQITPEYRHELNMAMSLFSVQKRDFGALLDARQIYYLSERSFVTLYPRQTINDLTMEKQNATVADFVEGLYAREAWQRRSERKVVLTGPYSDWISQQKIVTLSLPVVDQNTRATGALCIDLPFEAMAGALAEPQMDRPSSYHAFLVTQDGNALTGELPEALLHQPQGGWREFNEWPGLLFYEQALSEAPWRVVVRVEKRDIIREAIASKVLWLSFGGLLLFFLMTGWLVRRRFILPAVKLVRYLDQSAVLPTDESSVPAVWRGAFHTVFQVFNSNRRYIAQLNEENVALQKLFFDLHPTMMLVLEEDTYYVTQMNAAARAFYGEELLGKPATIIVANPEETIKMAQAELLSKGRAAFQTHHYRHDGVVRSIWLAVFPVVLQRRPLLLLIAEDITERLEMRDQLLSLREAERQRLKKSAQILFAVLEKIRQHTAYHAICTDEELRSVTEEIFPLLEDAGEMIRLDLDPLFIRSMNFSPATELESIFVQARPQLSKRNVSLAVYGLDGLPKQLCGDPVRFRRILSLLLEQVAVQQRQGMVMLHVSANAVNAAWLFQTTMIVGPQACELTGTEPCTPADGESGEDKFYLAVARRLAQTMGGELTVDYRAGEGATYWYSLRLQEAHEFFPANVPVTSLDKQGMAGNCVMIADASLASRRVLGVMAESLGHCVLYAETGAQAVARSQTESVGLIVLSLQLPDMDGWSVLAGMEDALAALGRRMPAVLFITEDDSEAVREKVKHTSAIGCLTKPVDELLFKEYVGAAYLTSAKIMEAGQLDKEEKSHFDELYLLRNLEGDRTLMRKILLDFVQTGPVMLADLSLAVTDGEAGKIAWQANKAKGAFASIGAERMRMLMLMLETAAETTTPDFKHLQELMNLIEQEYQKLKQCLEEWVRNE